MEMAGCLKVVLLVLQLLYFIVSGEEWFSNVPLRSNTPYQVLKHHLKTFDTKGIKTGYYSVLSVDQQSNHLLVGAKNVAILVDLDNIDSYVLWNVTTPPSRNTCDKEKDVRCNFVAVMLPFKDRIFLCWTGPSAACSWRNRTNLKEAPGRDSLGNVFESDVKEILPTRSPYQNDTAVITENGTLFRGKSSPNTRNSLIYGRRFNPSLLKATYSSYRQGQRWFYYDVEFVKSYDIGLYVYFFFRERSLECESCGNQVFSRVARICKGDYGGYYSLKNTFVTFQKAKLSCSDGKDYPVNFNEIQDVWWDESANLFHAIFTSHRNGPPATAICIYSLPAINRIFAESKFKTYNEKRVWATVDNKYPEYFPNCIVNPRYVDERNRPSVPDGMMATQRMTIEAYAYLNHDPLMDEPVQPTSSRAAWFIKDGIRMTAIALDKVGANTVVYASTDRGTVLKISQPVGRDQPCLITEMDVFPVGKKEVITVMALDTHRHILYLGSRTKLSKLSLEQCSGYLDESSCISAADPYCGWDSNATRCVSFLSYGKPSELKQNLSSCPKAKEVSWSPWKNCLQNDGNLCRCQVRPCQGENSRCVGGLEYRLENCTVDVTVGWEGEASWEALGVQHGNWSVWGTWSECSAKAWAGVRNRSRTCTNPAPRRGGRPCMGDAVQYEPCSLRSEEVEKSLGTNLIRVLNPKMNVAVRFHVKCRAKGYKLTDVSAVLTNETVDCEKESQTCGDGKWEQWGKWSDCTLERFQIRRRKCKQQPCVGERLQERDCSTPPKNCKGGVDKSWDNWSECVCDHKLPLKTGLKYRVPKCHRLCPNEASCPHTVEFGDCSCDTNASAQAIKDDPNEPVKASVGIGHVIGAAVAGCVVTIILFAAAVYFVNRKKKQLNVSKKISDSIHEAGNSFHEEGNESRYSTLPLENGEPRENVELLKNPRTPGYKDKNKSPRMKTPSPLKIILNKRKQKHPVERCPEEEV